MFFWPSQILGGRPSKSYTHVMTPVPRHVVWKMFFGDTPTSPEVIVANTLNFKANFKFSRLKFFGGTPVPLRVYAIKAWSISSACKIFGAQHPYGLKYSLPEKIHLGGSILANKTFLFVDQSSPDFFRGTREKSLSITFLSDFGYLESFRRYSRSKSKVVKNRAEFWTFFGPPKF